MLNSKEEELRIEQEIADQDIEDIEAACELYDRLISEREDAPICSACNGSGEGGHDGSTCQTCRGCGHEIDHAIGDFYD